MTFSANEHKPFEVRLDREMTMDTICRNLVAAGVLLPDETGRYKETLRTYEPLQLLKVLIVSHQLREYAEGG